MSSSTDYQIEIKDVVVTNSALLFKLAFPEKNLAMNLLNLKIAYDAQVAGNAGTFCNGALTFSNFNINTKLQTSRTPAILIPLRPVITGKYNGRNVQINLTISAPNVRFIPIRKSIKLSSNSDGSIRYSSLVKGSPSIEISPTNTIV